MVLLTGVLALLLAATPSDEELLRQAETAFQEGIALRERPDEARTAFRRAAEGYEQLRQRGASNSALLLNEGNAYLLSGDLPHALLAYRRARTLDPDNHDLRRQLDVARELAYAGMAPVVRPPSEDWPPWLPRPALRLRLLFAAALLALAWAALTRWRMTRRGGMLTAGSVALLVGLVIGASVALEAWRIEEDHAHPLVIVTRDRTVLRRGDGDEYPPREPVPPLNAGVEARLLGRRTDTRNHEWLQIELAGGEVGWLRAELALVDEP